MEEPRSPFPQYDNATTLALIGNMNRLREAKDELEAKLKSVNAEYNFLRLIKIPEAFDNDGVSVMKVSGVGRVSLTSDVYASIPDDHREGAYEYLRDTGRGSLIQETVNPSTLKAFVKEAMKKGEELPPELFKVTPFSRASITKA